MDLDWADAGRLQAGAEHADLYRKTLIMLTAAGLAAGAAACGSAVSQQSAQPAASSPAPAPARSAAMDAPVTVRPSAGGAASLRVLTEPQAGIGPIYQLITGAHSSVDLSMYELADPAADGIHVRWGPAGTTYHQKTLTVDDATSVIMTLNLVAEDHPGTRDFAVIDTNRAGVAPIAATFA